MWILALRATIITLFVASATLVLTDVQVVLAVIVPAPLLLVAFGGTRAARRMAVARSRPRWLPVRVSPGAPHTPHTPHTRERPDRSG